MLIKRDGSPLFLESILKYNYDFGTQFKTKSNSVCTLLKYINAKNVYVMFEDGTVVKVASGNLLTGAVKNPNHPSVFGVGINDNVTTTCYNDKRYMLWYSIIRRAYSDVYHKDKPTYKDVEVCDRWKRFSNFAEDIVKIPFYEKCINDEYELDKDILGGDLKVYSPETVCFIPRSVNVFFSRNTRKDNNLPTGVTFNKRLNKYVASCNTGGKNTQHLGVFGSIEEALIVYKRTKQELLKTLANSLKGDIEDKVYNKLLNYYDLE